MTWKEMDEKYPESREDMREEREQSFVDDCFSCYEQEGFSDTFWSPYDDHKDRTGQNFEVVGRCTTEECDLCALPMWHIRFTDGVVISAHPEEIIPSEMKNNGYVL